MPLLFWRPKPAPPGAFKGHPLPYQGASLLSKFFMGWIGDFMQVAYSRTIHADDLYDITPDLACGNLGDEVEARFLKGNSLFQQSVLHQGYQAISDHSPDEEEAEDTDARNGVQYNTSLFKAMFLTVWPQLFICFLLRLGSQTLRTLAPIVTKLLLEQLTLAYNRHNAVKQGLPTDSMEQPKSPGYMYGLAIMIWAMTSGSSIIHWFTGFWPALMGKKLSTALMTMISRKSLRLSPKARQEMTNGRLTTMLSVDSLSIENATHDVQVIPISILMLILGTGLLYSLLGTSALVGLAVLVLDSPSKAWMFKQVAKLRRQQSKLIDNRVRLLSEILNNIRAIKLYAYETWFGKKVTELRKKELAVLSRSNFLKSGLDASSQFMPTLAAILSFIFYSWTGHPLDPAIIFPSLQYFTVLKRPINDLPEIINEVLEAMVAFERVEKLLKAEEMQSTLNIQHDAEYGVDVEGDFQYESLVQPLDNGKMQILHGEAKQRPKTKNQPFSLNGINLQISKGALVCLVGRVGTGKTSLLSGLIKEMKQMNGHMIFGGTVSYVPQKAWVQSGSIQDNIAFSSDPEDIDHSRLNHIVDACALRTDVEMWPHGTLTKIGERGITLSGGQRQRICIARAAYPESDIVLLDDPLSAVDANVGHHILQNCILQGPMANRTRILVTHQLDVLPMADLVLVMDRDENGDGRIVQQGSFEELSTTSGIFQELMQNYGSKSTSASNASSFNNLFGLRITAAEVESIDGITKDTSEPAAKLYLDEERAQGAVRWSVYINYAHSVGSWFLLLAAASMFLLTQVSSVLNSLFLGYWSEEKFKGLSQGAYMGIYAGLGMLMAFFSWGAKYSVFIAGKKASFDMFNKACAGVMSSPLSWHDRTPTGRIISRLSKDVELLDDKLATTWSALFNAFLNIIAMLVLMLYVYPLAALLVLPVVFFSYVCSAYAREASRDTNRLASLMRSHIFTRFGEQLSGLSIIRAFGRQGQFVRNLEDAVDTTNVADYCGPFIQRNAVRWMGIRLSISTYSCILFVALFGVQQRNNVSPALFGVVLTFVYGTIAKIADIVNRTAQAEQQMNTVERIQYYMRLESEAPPHLPCDPNPKELWPTGGEVSFKNVQMRYRPDLPLVLKGVDFTIRPGEKVGIIGRTGAGKSSIAQVMFRTVEICGGKIEVDGVDLRSIGLTTLRERLAIIPQDSFLFGGSVRENIDPTGSHTNAELNLALGLVHHNPSASQTLQEKFHLDAVVADEGLNFSAGEQQLLALVRALVKGSKVLLLDEATSSVDPETDALIQRIIQTEFSDVTLISIAHRLQTVAYYDRIIVMDAGQVTEFDSPLALFDNPASTFRLLCNKKNITRPELVRIREDAKRRA
ncbi:hypothetical protein CI109_103657 [Kwoniella shandongensis]|uniref:Uncharacterized protein n=1 Tax=Kwoniella shandongensis TaxID=1734106 RepID=A0AAJ8LLB9_9TREE